MNRETFLSSFAYIADAPGGIDTLRDTIRQLAVEGRLVPQSAKDEPASHILQACLQRKRALVQGGTVRRRAELPAITSDELSFTVPPGWALARLDSWCDIAGGVAKGRKLSGHETVTLPYLRVANVKAGYLLLDEVKTIGLPFDEVPRYSLRAGDVLLTEGGDWDKLGRSAIWGGEIDPCLHQNHIFRARPLTDGVLPEWISLFTNSKEGRRYFQSKAKRTTNLASINMTELRSTPLPVPPTEEQHRICGRVNELMRLCDEFVTQQAAHVDARTALTAATLHRVSRAEPAREVRGALAAFADNIDIHLASGDGDLAAIKHLRQAILDMAVRGRLSRQDASDEPVAELQNRIATERSRRVRAKEMRKPATLPPIESADCAFDVPDHWVWCRLGEVCQTRLGKMLDAQKNTGTLRRYLRNSSAQWNRFELGDLKEIRVEDCELGEYSLSDGDLVVVEGGEPGRCAVWDSDLADGIMVFQKALHRVRPEGGVSARFLALLLRNGVNDGRLQGLFTGTTIKHLTGEKLKLYAIPLPPVQEQHRIVDRVSELMAVCNELEQQLVTARTARGELANSVVAHAILI